MLKVQNSVMEDGWTRWPSIFFSKLRAYKNLPSADDGRTVIG